MPNITKVLREEVSRIARKEAKQAVAPFRKPTAGARRTFADLKRRMIALEKTAKEMRGRLEKISAAAPQPAPEQADKARITAKGMKSLRKRLSLSGNELAKLLGITGQAVYNWETRSGALRVRDNTRAAILAVRTMGAREARQRLAELKAKTVAAKSLKAKKRAGKRVAKKAK